MTQETMSAQDAVAVLAEARGFTGSLRTRTMGIIAMVWGLVLTGMWCTFWAVSVTRGLSREPAAYAAAWIPWVLMGWVVSYAVWRSASITVGDRPPRLLRWIAMVAIVTIVMLAVARLFAVWASEPMPTLAGMGSAAVTVGFLMRRTPGRLPFFLAGALLLLTAIALTLAHAPPQYAGMAGLIAIPLPYLAGGLYLTLRG